MLDAWHSKTLAVRHASTRSEYRENSDAIFLTSSFVFKNAQHAKECFAGEGKGFVYSRFTNPNVDALAERMAALEKAKFGLLTSSGMSAIMILCLALLEAGDEVVCARELFGTSVRLFSQLLVKFGIKVNFVPLTDYEAWQKAVNSKTKFIFCESPSNPLLQIADIEKLAEIAHQSKALLIVDNCLATPALQNPIDFGADIVMHSMTKFIDGGGRCLGGSIVTNDEEIYQKLFAILRMAGPALSPFNAWVLLKSIETLYLRMESHSKNALLVSEWLQKQPFVKCVYHPALASAEQQSLANKQMKRLGAIVSFEINGNKQDAWNLIDQCKLFSITANLGDARSSICHPATTTHNAVDESLKQEIGITESLIRLSIGLEDVQDLCNDLKI